MVEMGRVWVGWCDGSGGGDRWTVSGKVAHGQESMKKRREKVVSAADG